MQEIKKLGWRRFGERDMIADINFGCYVIWHEFDGVYSATSFTRNKNKHQSIVAAKDFCQKDFERIVLENIVDCR